MKIVVTLLLASFFSYSASAQDGIPPSFNEAVDPSKEQNDPELKDDDAEAQEQPTPVSAPPPEVERKPEPKPVEKSGNNDSSSKVFKPTEEISDDSPVPFPVDI